MPIVRGAQAHESEALGRLGYAAWKHGPLSQLDGGRTDRERLLRDFIATCARMTRHIRVAETDGRLLGWGARENGDAYISDLWVNQGDRGQGVGQMVLAALEDDIRNAGYRAAELETHAGNRQAVAFYERRGYAVSWRGEKFSTSLGYSIEKLRLKKLLTPIGETAAP